MDGMSAGPRCRHGVGAEVVLNSVLNVSSGSLDVSAHADEAGEPAHAQQRPLRAGFCPPPPRQEAPTAVVWNLGRERVTFYVDWRGSEQQDGRRPGIWHGIFFSPLSSGRRASVPFALKQNFTRTETDSRFCVNVFFIIFFVQPDTMIKSQDILDIMYISVDLYPRFCSDCW